MSENPNKLIQNVQRLSGSYYLSAPTNAPVQYKDRQYEYLDGRNKKFSQRRAKYSNDYVIADVQGLNPDDFYEWKAAYVRFSDLNKSSSMATRKSDDWKEVMFPQEDIDYFPIGAKLETMGNTWLNINPSNIGGAYATAVVARCNSAYNSYDHYGNIITEPLYVEAYNLSKPTPYTELYHLNLMDGNVHITCQLNENTKKLGETKRLILGSKVYYISGYADYIQEFTGDRDSTHLITFSANVTEPTELDDMLETFIVNGKAESFSAAMNMRKTMATTTFMPISEPMFIHNDVQVPSTEEYPITWKYDSSDESIASITSLGQRYLIHAKAAGTVTIRATMNQNPNIRVSTELTVTDSTTEPYIEFSEYKDTTIKQYTNATYSATYYDENGAATEESLNWRISGADYCSDYSYTVSDDGRSVTINCLSASVAPLYVTASHGNVSQTITLILEGY